MRPIKAHEQAYFTLKTTDHDLFRGSLEQLQATLMKDALLKMAIDQFNSHSLDVLESKKYSNDQRTE